MMTGRHLGVQASDALRLVRCAWWDVSESQVMCSMPESMDGMGENDGESHLRLQNAFGKNGGARLDTMP
jgi:hypothetical protein